MKADAFVLRIARILISIVGLALLLRDAEAGSIVLPVVVAVVGLPFVVYVLAIRTLAGTTLVGLLLVGTASVLLLPLSDDGLHGVPWIVGAPVAVAVAAGVEASLVRRGISSRSLFAAGALAIISVTAVAHAVAAPEHPPEAAVAALRAVPVPAELRLIDEGATACQVWDQACVPSAYRMYRTTLPEGETCDLLDRAIDDFDPIACELRRNRPAGILMVGAVGAETDGTTFRLAASGR